MKIGYARVSTDDQSVNLQLDALRRVGCDRIFADTGLSGAIHDRPALNEALEALVSGDQLIIWKLDRLGRSLSQLIQTVTDLESHNIGLVSISEVIDTSSPGGVLIFHIMGALAQFERALISERTKAGMAAARDLGRHLGRPRKLDHNQIQQIAREVCHNGETANSLAQRLGVSRTTVYRALRQAELTAAAALASEP